MQVLGIPVAEEFDDYLRDVLSQMQAKGIRVELDDSDDRFPKKIRNASKSKVPFVLIAGEDDRSAGAVSFRYRDGDAEERRAGRRRDRRDPRGRRLPPSGVVGADRRRQVPSGAVGDHVMSTSGAPSSLSPSVHSTATNPWRR